MKELGMNAIELLIEAERIRLEKLWGPKPKLIARERDNTLRLRAGEVRVENCQVWQVPRANTWVLNTVLCLAVLCLAAPVPAQAELLAEIHHTAHRWDANPSATFSFFAYTGALFNDHEYMQHDWSPANAGTVASADAETVATMNGMFLVPQGKFWLESFGSLAGTATSGSVDEIWNGTLPAGDDGTGTATMHVPRLGFGLTGYRLTDITHTLDSYTVHQQGRYLIADEADTIRLYGERGMIGDFNADDTVNAADYVALRNSGAPAEDFALWRAHFGQGIPFAAGAGAIVGSVPEPAAWLLVLLAVLWHASKPGRGSR
jgi:hypothetical protein